MRTVSIACISDGAFTGLTITASDADIESNIALGHIAVEGVHDPRNRRFDLAKFDPDTTIQGSGGVSAYQPVAPSADHDWVEASETWELKPEVLARQRAARSARLAIGELEEKQQRALLEHALGIAPEPGQPTAAERLAAIHAAKVELRKKL